MNNTVPDIIGNLLRAMDSAGDGFVSSLYGQIAYVLHGYFVLLLTLYVIWWGYTVISGSATVSPLEAAERLAKVVFIFWIATNWGPFSKSLYTLIQYLPEQLAAHIIPLISHNGDVKSVNDIPVMFNRLYAATIELVGQIYNGTLQDTFAALFSTTLIVVTLLFVGASLAGLIIAKVMLNIVLALAPVWIILALYKYSSRFTAGFLSATVNLVIQQILIYGFLAFYYHVVILALDFSGRTVGNSFVEGRFSQVMPLLLVMIIGIYVLIRIPSIAFMITGGAHSVGGSISAALTKSREGKWRPSELSHGGRATLNYARREAVRASIQKEAARNSMGGWG
ncbi:type IV secretion system protein [Brucella intermedia]|uniref:type IV secretion system protein n=1 Tax=Brucella intermedia TaxID=94625 RepID=UPI00235E526B|nr:type IV secretion system protein [Brucella intermedia]